MVSLPLSLSLSLSAGPSVRHHARELPRGAGDVRLLCRPVCGVCTGAVSVLSCCNVHACVRNVRSVLVFHPFYFINLLLFSLTQCSYIWGPPVKAGKKEAPTVVAPASDNNAYPPNLKFYGAAVPLAAVSSTAASAVGAGVTKPSYAAVAAAVAGASGHLPAPATSEGAAASASAGGRSRRAASSVEEDGVGPASGSSGSSSGGGKREGLRRRTARA